MGRRLRCPQGKRGIITTIEGERLVDFEVLDVGADGKLKKKKEIGHEIGKPEMPVGNPRHRPRRTKFIGTSTWRGLSM